MYSYITQLFKKLNILKPFYNTNIVKNCMYLYLLIPINV